MIFIYKHVLLLDDVFEKVINTCLEYYGLDPCHYFSNPGLGWIKSPWIKMQYLK